MNEDLNKTNHVEAPEIITENSTTNNTNYTVTKTNKSNSKIILILIGILLTIVLIASFIYIHMTKPESIVKNSINVFFESIKLQEDKNTYELLNDLLNNEKFLDYNFKVDTNFNELKSLLLNISGNLNLPEAKAFLNYSFSNNDYELLNGSLNIDGKKLYIKDKNITDNSYIHTNTDSIILNKDTFKSKAYINEYNDVINVVKTVLLNNIPEDSLSQVDETLKIDKKEIKTKKTTFTINEELGLKITKELMIALKANESFITLATNYSISKEDLVKQMDKLIEELNEVVPSKNTLLSFDFYNKGLKPLKYGINIYDLEENKLSLSTNILIYDAKDFDYQISLTDNTYAYTIDIRQLTEDSYKIDFKEDNTIFITATYKYTNDTSELKITSQLFTANISITNKVDYGKFKIDINLANIYKVNLTTDLSVDNSNSTIKANVSEISASKDANKLTQEEINKLQENLFKILNEAPFMEFIFSLQQG